MSVLKIHLTYHCSAQCDHCHLRGRLAPASVIDLALALGVIRELQRLKGLDYVVLLGGEPGLYPELTHRLVREVTALGLGSRVETNASWATSAEAAQRFLEPLHEAGTSVMYSLDCFHEQFVPPERVLEAMRVSERLKGDYVVEVPYLDFHQRSNAQDRRTSQIVADIRARLGNGARLRLFEGPLFFKGRAAARLAAQVSRRRGVPQDLCDTVPWWSNGSQRTLDLLGLDAEGNLSKECGIAIGNVRRKSVAQIIDSFRAEAHPILSRLISAGPLALAREATELGYVIKEDYADKCHLCQEARDVLRTRYPEYLAPAEQYEDAIS